MIYVKKPNGTEWIVIETFLGRMLIRKDVMDNPTTIDTFLLNALKGKDGAQQ